MLQAHQLSEYLDRTQPVKSLARSDVQQIRKLVQLLLAVLGQIGSLWQKLADKSVGVLVGPALPGAVRVATPSLPAKSSANWVGFPKDARKRMRKTVQWYPGKLEWCQQVLEGSYQGERLGFIDFKDLIA